MAASRTFTCPACGEDVPAKAKACPHCGACEKSGWREDGGEGLDLPDEEFDYEKFTEEEFGTPRRNSNGKGKIWRVTAIVLLVTIVIFYVIDFAFR
jgi:hypothetical protein